MDISIKVEEVPKNTMFLKNHLGDGTLGKTKFTASLILPTMALLVEVDGKRYKVNQQDVIQAVIIKSQEASK